MSDSVDIRVLGPIEVHVAGLQVSLAPLERGFLGVLAARPTMAASVSELVAAMWDKDPPRSARGRIRVVVSSLRRSIGTTLRTGSAGYYLDIADDRIDRIVFERAVTWARTSAATGRLHEAAMSFRKALAIWRGPALSGGRGLGVGLEAARLEEMRWNAVEQCLDIELALGQHADVIPELAGAVAAHPQRERFRTQLMLALYRSRRQAEALAAYRAFREHLADTLGLEPSPELQRLHTDMLRGDSSLDLPAAANVRAALTNRWVPAELPAVVGHFTGRDDELTTLDGAVGDSPVVVLSGPAGIGKTALAVQWGNRVLDRFVDGQLFLSVGQSSAGAVVSRALRALGVLPTTIPTELTEQVALYRTLVHDRRLLVVADDASCPEQVLPLVPPTPTGVLVVTSRQRLTPLGLHHAVHHLELGPLSNEESALLLRRVMGKVEHDHDARSATMVARCSGVPIALRTAAVSLIARAPDAVPSVTPR